MYIRMTKRTFSTGIILVCLLFIDVSFVIEGMESLKVPLSSLEHHRALIVGT